MATTPTAPKAASAGTLNYSPDTRLDLTINVPEDYDLSTVTAVFELREAGAVVFRYSSGVDSNLSISDQVITVAIDPGTDSEDSLNNTITDILDESGEMVEWNLDLAQTGSDTVDYRIQGRLSVLPTHGEF